MILKKTVSYVKQSYMAVLKISEHVEYVLVNEFSEVDIIPIFGVSYEVESIVIDIVRRLGKNVERIENLKSVGKVLYLDCAGDAFGNASILEEYRNLNSRSLMVMGSSSSFY